MDEVLLNVVGYFLCVAGGFIAGLVYSYVRRSSQLVELEFERDELEYELNHMPSRGKDGKFMKREHPHG